METKQCFHCEKLFSLSILTASCSLACAGCLFGANQDHDTEMYCTLCFDHVFGNPYSQDNNEEGFVTKIKREDENYFRRRSEIDGKIGAGEYSDGDSSDAD